MTDRPTDTGKLDDGELTSAMVRSPHWQWMKGIVLRDGRTVSDVRGDPHWVWLTLADGGMETTTLHCLPDVDHPATRGCLLQMIRDAIGRNVSTFWGVQATWLWTTSWSITVGGKRFIDESEGRLLAHALLSLSDTPEEETP